MAAVAAVINNRSNAWGQTPTAIVSAPHQFEGYTNPSPGGRANQADPALRAAAEQVWNGVTSGSIPDPTNGGLNYFASYMAAPPSWAQSAVANGQTTNIGGNIFLTGNGTVPPASIPNTGAYADTGAAATAPAPAAVSTALPSDTALQNVTNPDGSVNWGAFYNGLVPAAAPTPAPQQTLPVPLAPDMRQADRMVSGEFNSLGAGFGSDAATSLATNPDLLPFTPNLNTPNIGYTGPAFDAGYDTNTDQVVPYATANSAANFRSPAPTIADDSTGFPSPATTTPATPTMTTAGGDSYTAGKTYTLPDGATFVANADGSFTKTASTPRSMTPIQLALAAAAPGAISNLNSEVAGAQNLGSQAGSAIGSLFNNLFSPGATSAPGAAPAAPASAAAPSTAAPYDNTSLGALVDSEFNSLPSSAYNGMDAGTSLAFNPALLAGESAPSFTAQPTLNYANGTVSPPILGGYDPGTTGTALNPVSAANGAIYTGQGIAGTAQLPANYQPPAGTVPGSAPDTSWNDLINSFNSGVSSMPMNQPNAAAVATAPTSKTVLSQQLNPAYSAWLSDQNSAIYGVQGVDSPSLDADGNVVLPSSYLGAAPAAAPAKYLTVKKTVPVVAPAPAAQAPSPDGLGGVLGIAAALQPVASTNGYIYQPNGNGGYTNIGTATPNLTPAQQYSAALASMTGLAPNGDPNGNVGGISTSGYNLMTGSQGGNNASQNRVQSPGGSISGVS